MEQFFTDIFGVISEISPLWAYLCILGLAYMENVLPPIPGDMAVVLGGYLAGLGRLDLWLVVLLCTLGGATGFWTMYAIGCRAGSTFVEGRRFQWLPREAFARVQAWMGRWGVGVIAANRFLSGARSVIALSAGIAGMARRPVLLYATLSALVWTTLLAGMGFFLGERWDMVRDYLARYGQVMLIVLGFFLALQILRTWRRKKIGEES